MSYRIDEPCNEDWDAMEPREGGRFCQSCAHVVVDATKMSKKEFEAFFDAADGDVCAQFLTNPLGDGVFRRALTPPRPLGSFVLLSTLLASACASESAPPIEPEEVQVILPGIQLVEDRRPSSPPPSTPSTPLSSLDAGVDAGVDAGAVPRRTLGRPRYRH